MNCPSCRSYDVKVIDSRPNPNSVYRRRQCKRCKHRWSTVEVAESRAEKDLGKLVDQLKDEVMAAFEAFDERLESGK